MAPLNPAIQPTNDPNYRGYSQPISVPDTIKERGVETNTIMPKGQEIGDRSAEFEGKAQSYKMAADSTGQEAYGELFKNLTEMGAFAGKAGVAMVKKDIEDKVYEVADRERQQYTQTLESIKAKGQLGGVLNSSADENSLPADISGLDDHLSSLKSAKDGGKISSSYYEGRLLSEAKKLRAQYPGFRNEVDEAFAKVTGSNPANAYVRALTSDINKSANSAGSELKKAETFILQRPGMPGAEKTLNEIRSGGTTDPLGHAMRWAAPYEQQEWGLRTLNNQMTNSKMTREETVATGGLLFDKAAGVAVSRVADRLAGKMGIHSAEDAAQLETAAKAGAISNKNWTEISADIAQSKIALQVQMRKDAQAHGLVAILGQKEIDTRIEQATKSLDWMQERIWNHDYGGFYQAQQTAKSLTDDAKVAMLQHPKLGPILQMTSALKDIGGESNLIALSKEIIKGDFPSNMKDYADKWTKGFATQYNMRTSGVPVTFNDFIEDVQKKAQTDPSYNNKRMNKEIIGKVDIITRPDISDEIKMNVAKAAFSPENRGMISKLSADGVDSMGRPISGQAAVFQNFTKPEMTKAMFELGKKDPQAWKNYVDWTQETIANDLAGQDISTLAQIRNPAIRVGWDSDNKRLVPTYDEGKSVMTQGRPGLMSGGVSSPGRAGTDTEYQNVQRVVSKMNGYLNNYKNVAEAAGIPVDAFLIKTIANAQGGQGKEAIANMNSIPFNILRDLGLAQMKAGPK